MTILLLSSDDIIASWTRKKHVLEGRIPDVMKLWWLVVSSMPPIAHRWGFARAGAGPFSVH